METVVLVFNVVMVSLGVGTLVVALTQKGLNGYYRSTDRPFVSSWWEAADRLEADIALVGGVDHSAWAPDRVVRMRATIDGTDVECRSARAVVGYVSLRDWWAGCLPSATASLDGADLSGLFVQSAGLTAPLPDASRLGADRHGLGPSYRVWADAPEVASELLDDGRVRDAFRQLEDDGDPPEVRLEEGELEVTLREPLWSGEELVAFLRDVCAVAAALRDRARALGRPGGPGGGAEAAEEGADADGAADEVEQVEWSGDVEW
ncbi:MAG: hypothetical protein ABEL76_10695 [Bradymonadaceae bacterium]